MVNLKQMGLGDLINTQTKLAYLDPLNHSNDDEIFNELKLREDELYNGTRNYFSRGINLPSQIIDLSYNLTGIISKEIKRVRFEEADLKEYCILPNYRNLSEIEHEIRPVAFLMPVLPSSVLALVYSNFNRNRGQKLVVDRLNEYEKVLMRK